MRILCIIPARYGSTRFPGKPLVDIAGKSMIRRVYEQAAKSTLLTKIVVATDHEEILNEVRGFGGNAVMTSPDHNNGTERCLEALRLEKSGYDYVLNIQGDEPFTSEAQINALVALLDGTTELGSLYKKINDPTLIFNPNVVKVVLDANSQALYFSREPLPHLRGADRQEWPSKIDYLKHVGLYAYRTNVLEKIVELPQGKLEAAESLEQLRWLEHGFKIKLAETVTESIGIDTPEDLERAMAFLKTFEG